MVMERRAFLSFALALTSVRDPSVATRDARLRLMVDQHFDAVWRALRRLGVPAGAADDEAQKVFLVAARRLPEIEAGGERQYLLGIAWRVASDARHALFRRREVPLGDMDPELSLGAAPARRPDEALEQKQALELLAALLDEMPQALRDAFVLFELEELSAIDVARLLKVPVGTVASRVRRAREHILKGLESRRGP
jgi:RNA polymerase sigma-70 factor (ECF subfamily)